MIKKTRSLNYLWVVEAKEKGKWMPTVWGGLTRKVAREGAREFRQQCYLPTRIRLYWPEGSFRRGK